MKLIYLNKYKLSLYIWGWIKDKIEIKKEYRYANKLLVRFSCRELFSVDLFASIIFVGGTEDIYRVVFYKNYSRNNPVRLERNDLANLIEFYGYS